MPVVFTHAESDWVQLFTDTGIPGLALVLAAGALLAVHLFRKLRRSQSQWSRTLALAGLVALVGVRGAGDGQFQPRRDVESRLCRHGPGAGRQRPSVKILLTTGIFPPDIGGPATYVPFMAEALVRNGHDVTVVCLADDPRASPGRYPFRLVRLPRREPRLARLARTVLRLTREGRGADVVFGNGLLLEVGLAAAMLRAPLVLKVVGDWAWERATNAGATSRSFEEFQLRGDRGRRSWAGWLRSLMVRRGRAVIVPSEYLARWVAGWRVAPERIHVVYNAYLPEDAPEIARTPSGDVANHRECRPSRPLEARRPAHRDRRRASLDRPRHRRRRTGTCASGSARQCAWRPWKGPLHGASRAARDARADLRRRPLRAELDLRGPATCGPRGARSRHPGPGHCRRGHSGSRRARRERNPRVTRGSGWAGSGDCRDAQRPCRACRDVMRSTSLGGPLCARGDGAPDPGSSRSGVAALPCCDRRSALVEARGAQSTSDAPLMPESLRAVARGSMSLVLGQYGAAALGLAATAATAHLLGPADFGLVALAMAYPELVISVLGGQDVIRDHPLPRDAEVRPAARGNGCRLQGWNRAGHGCLPAGVRHRDALERRRRGGVLRCTRPDASHDALRAVTAAAGSGADCPRGPFGHRALRVAGGDPGRGERASARAHRRTDHGGRRSDRRRHRRRGRSERRGNCPDG